MAPLLLFILLTPLHLQVNSQDLSSEQAILLSLKQHWDAPSSLRWWNSTSSSCDWPEVKCAFGTVTGLKLADSNIRGTIPSTICLLTNLDSIYLARNFLYGDIPASLYNCSKLVRLDLSMNELSGKIPGELLLHKRLTHLWLHGNRLVGAIPAPIEAVRFPKSLTELTGLRTLDLSENQLSGGIENVVHLRSMSVLRLCSNNFSGKVPREFVNRFFHENCFDISNLCSEDPRNGLPGSREYLKCQSKHDESEKHFVIMVVVIVGCGVVVFAILFYLLRRWLLKRHKIIDSRRGQIWPTSPSVTVEDEWKMITFQRLKFNKTEILSSLADENLIGYGGSGKVYRVFVNEGSIAVAIKSIVNPRKSDHGLEKEFLAEIKTLGTIWHNNIVKLLCYLSTKEVKLLVYQYVENKSLHQWLHGRSREISSAGDCPVTKLEWPMRLHIAIGAAQGLCYMHHDCSPTIIHRDIKSRNILLDSELNAKIADFGLSKLLSRQGDTETASSIAGTFGYIPPEYAYTSKVNRKTDVYSFGVVLLELTTGREAVTYGDHMNLAERAHLHYRDTNAIIDAVDDEIKETIYMDQIITVFRLGVICTATSPSNRPFMKDCLHILQNCRRDSS
ncbi:LRR receptor-like serine/threonine-protein kinase RGI5 isoform X2 [Salvia splendens]|uniref:LRR receptor-like serine/threonine-protein kinase RGI5 isoform X2 n=1 Tax=Salvia splendens TaxID=180675 RepID=UPI001C27EF47|nr:LRR receptor-like serine/threonine-protein kinase RGI5 isoform X2 [Salvia splendens]